jgi:hypothetical protein
VNSHKNIKFLVYDKNYLSNERCQHHACCLSRLDLDSASVNAKNRFFLSSNFITHAINILNFLKIKCFQQKWRDALKKGFLLIEALLVHTNLEMLFVDAVRWNFSRKMFVVDADVWLPSQSY